MPGAEKKYAVLTGDVVGSSRFEPADLKALMQRLRKGSEAFAKAFPGVVRGQLDVFSGDGWQMLLEDWRKALRAALFLRAVVRSDEQLKADTRVAIGLGRIDQETLNPKRVSEATGQAFERSGRALKELKKPFRMTWAVTGEESPDASQQGRLLVGALRLLDEMISRWKPKQAQSMALALLGRQQAHIASELGVAQPTVSHSLKSAGWKGIAALLAEVET